MFQKTVFFLEKYDMFFPEKKNICFFKKKCILEKTICSFIFAKNMTKTYAFYGQRSKRKAFIGNFCMFF